MSATTIAKTILVRIVIACILAIFVLGYLSKLPNSGSEGVFASKAVVHSFLSLLLQIVLILKFKYGPQLAMFYFLIVPFKQYTILVDAYINGYAGDLSPFGSAVLVLEFLCFILLGAYWVISARANPGAVLEEQ